MEYASITSSQCAMIGSRKPIHLVDGTDIWTKVRTFWYID